MKRPARPVVLVSLRGLLARLTVVNNGAGYTITDVVALAKTAGAEPRSSHGAVLLTARQLPDVEALARVRGVVFQHRKGAPKREAVEFQPAARIGIDAEPLHACARAACRTPGCRWEAS